MLSFVVYWSVKFLKIIWVGFLVTIPFIS
jgi:hypothetical protein